MLESSALTSDQLQALSPAQLSRLSNAQIVAFTSDAFEALDTSAAYATVPLPSTPEDSDAGLGFVDHGLELDHRHVAA